MAVLKPRLFAFTVSPADVQIGLKVFNVAKAFPIRALVLFVFVVVVVCLLFVFVRLFVLLCFVFFRLPMFACNISQVVEQIHICLVILARLDPKAVRLA